MDNLIVYGGPGSGKTTQLSEIYSELIADGLTPDEIACVAFNKSVAYEIAGRISFATDLFDDDLLTGWVATFHALCRRLLATEFDVKVLEPINAAKEYLQFLKESQNYQETGNERQILYLLIQLHDLHREAQVKQDFWLYCRDYMKTEIKRNQHWGINDARRVFQKSQFINTYKLFYEYRMTHNPIKLTFYELLSVTMENIDRFKDRFTYILIDEVQDFSPLMWDILQSFNATKILIGDPDQSIYGFRNVSSEFFLTLPYKKEIMPFTYRFDTEYAQMLERGISILNKKRQRKETIGKGGHIKIHNFIPSKIEEGIVLGRTNFVLYKYSQRLVSDLIPHVFEEFSLYGNRTYNPLKDKFCAIQVFLKSKTLKQFAKNMGDLIDENDYNILPLPLKIEFLKERCKDDYELFTHIKDLPLREKVKLCQRSRRLRDQAKALMRVQNAEQFLKDLKNPRVILSTVHRFKGREHDNIYIPDFKDGLFPMRKGNFEEEARICYVALSRVKKNLYLKGNSPFWQKFFTRRNFYVY